MTNERIYVVRLVDYDGGKRGMTWNEWYYKHDSKSKAEDEFNYQSMPKLYGKGCFKEFVEIKDLNRKPKGLIKAVVCWYAALVVEMCEVEVM